VSVRQPLAPVVIVLLVLLLLLLLLLALTWPPHALENPPLI